MEGKKNIAIVLFLLIGLTLFAFANPVEEEKGSKKKKENGDETQEVSEEKEEIKNNILETQEEEKTLTYVAQNTTTPVSTENKVEQTEEKEVTYEEALEAIEKAETTFDENDINNARKLVEQLKDEKEKEELNERIDILEETIEAIAAIEELAEKILLAENKDDIKEAIEYRDNIVINIIENLKSEESKESIQEVLDIMNIILDDTTAPMYSGIANNETTKSNVSLTIADETAVVVTITLNGTEIEYEEGKEFTEEGVYSIKLVDAAFNETSLIFTIDKITKEDLETSTEAITIATGEEVVLDLENATVESNFIENARYIKNEGTLIIKNGKIINNNTGYTYGMIDNYGTVTLENVEIEDNGNGYGSTIRNRANATMTIKNTTVNDTGTGSDGNIPLVIDGGNVTIENSSFTANAPLRYPIIINGGNVTFNGTETKVKGIHGGLAISSGTVEINGGSFEGQNYYGIWITNNDTKTAITINDGTFVGGLNGLRAEIDDGNQDAGDVEITINGGDFSAKAIDKAAVFVNKADSVKEWTTAIHAGTFSTDVSSYLAPTSTQTEIDGKFVVTRNS